MVLRIFDFVLGFSGVCSGDNASLQSWHHSWLNNSPKYQSEVRIVPLYFPKSKIRKYKGTIRTSDLQFGEFLSQE